MRSRLCVRGCFQQAEDVGKLFASTPARSVLKLLIVASMAMGLGICCFDITTALRHASLEPKRVVDRLRVTPGDWQDRFAFGMTKCGFRRLQGDGNFYVHGE